MAERGFFKQSKGHFALDATDLETTPQCQGGGLKKYTEWKVNKEKQLVEVERFAYGFKVLIVYEVHLRLVVAAKLVPIQKHESQFTLSLVRQAIKNMGGGCPACAAHLSRLSGRAGSMGAEARSGHRARGAG